MGKDTNSIVSSTPQEISKMLDEINVLAKLPKIKNDDELQDRVDWYFDFCVKKGIRPGMEGLALAIGVDRRTLWDWRAGNSRVGSRAGEIVEEAKRRLATFHEALMLTGRINPVTGIFLAKNNFNYSDKTELEIFPKTPLGSELTPDEIAKRVQLPPEIPVDVDCSDE